jgi:hypothetical protein
MGGSGEDVGGRQEVVLGCCGFFVCLFVFWQYWGLTHPRQALYHLSHSASPFCVGYF